MMKTETRKRIALVLWWLGLTLVGIFVLPVCVALGGALYSIHPDEPDFWIKFMIHHYLIPCGIFGFTIGVLATLPVAHNRLMSCVIPGLALMAFYIVFQRITYLIEWSTEYLLNGFLPTWIPLIGFSLIGGVVSGSIRRLTMKCEHASAT